MGGRRTRSAAQIAGASAALGLAIASAAAAAGPGATQRERAAALRHDTTTLVARRHAALLDLYALDTRWNTTRTRLSQLVAAATRLQRAEASIGVQLESTQYRLASSQQRLGVTLRALYEQGDVNTIAVVLSAQSLDDAVTRIDDLNAVAARSNEIVATAVAAKSRLVRLRSLLLARSATLQETIASVRGSIDRLAAARNERAVFVERLSSRERLEQRQIRTLETAARAAERKSAHIQAAATRASTPAPSASLPTAPAPAATSSRTGKRTLTVSSTGYSLHGHTATGLPTSWGVVAVDPKVIPLGSRLTVLGYGEAVAADVGSGVRGPTIDLWFPTLAQARAWGRRTVTVTLH